jgi:hypothetical protein
VPIEDFLNAGALTAGLEKLDRVFCNVGRSLAGFWMGGGELAMCWFNLGRLFVWL